MSLERAGQQPAVSPAEAWKKSPLLAILSRLVLGPASDRSIITATYAQELSDDFGRRVRNLVSDGLHRAIFPGCALSEDSVCTTWAATDNGYYLLHLWRGRVEFPELKRMVGVLAEEWKPHAVLIEDSASGQSLIQELKAATRLPVLPVKVDTDKVSRAQAITPLIEAGKVFLPAGAAWLNDYIDELATFPTARTTTRWTARLLR